MTHSKKNRSTNQPIPIHLSSSGSQSSLELEELIAFAINYLKPLLLSDLQEKILRFSWENKTYTKIADITHNDPDYLKGVGAKLWKILSEAMSDKVTKRNLKLVTKRNYQKLKKFNQDCQQAEKNIPKVTKLIPNSMDLCKETVTNKYQYWDEVLDTSFFRGRIKELATLEKWVVKDRCRLVALVGIRGMGKTALANKLAQQVEAQFDCTVWKSLRDRSEITSVLEEINLAIGDRKNYYVADTIANQINNSIKYMREKRCLLIFDAVENILNEGQLGGTYLDSYQSFGQLLRRVQDEQHQSCVLITSSEKPIGISLREYKNNLVRSHIVKGLVSNEAREILSDYALIGSDSTLQELINCCGGNPLILKIISNTTETLFQGRVRAFLNCESMLYGNIREVAELQYKRLSELEHKLINYLLLENNSISICELLNNRKLSIPSCQIIEVLESLQAKYLIEINETGVEIECILFEYLKRKL